MEENLDENVNKDALHAKHAKILVNTTIENSLNFSYDATGKTEASFEQTTTTYESNESSGLSSPLSPSMTASLTTESKEDQANNLSSITKSTVVITDSQILEFNNPTMDKFVEVENSETGGASGGENQNGHNLNYTSSNNDESQNDDNNLNDVSTSKDDEEEEIGEVVDDDGNSKEEQASKEERSSLEKQFSSEFTHLNSNEEELQEENLVGSSEHLSDDYEKDYEITNVENMKNSDAINEEINGKLNESKLAL
jgi:hypothetical protein